MNILRCFTSTDNQKRIGKTHFQWLSDIFPDLYKIRIFFEEPNIHYMYPLNKSFEYVDSENSSLYQYQE